MKRRIIIPALLAAAFFQTLLPDWKWFGGTEMPLVLMVLLYTALNAERGCALFAAVLAALLTESLSPMPFGSTWPFFIGFTLLLNAIRHDLFGDSVLPYPLFGAGAALLMNLYFMMVFGALGLRPAGTLRVFLQLIGGIVAAAVAAPAAYLLLAPVQRMLARRRRVRA